MPLSCDFKPFVLKKELESDYIADRHAQQLASTDDYKKFSIIAALLVLLQAALDYRSSDQKVTLALIVIMAVVSCLLLLLMIKRIKEKLKCIPPRIVEAIALVVFVIAAVGIIAYPIVSDYLNPYSLSTSFHRGLLIGLEVLIIITFFNYYNARWILSIVMITIMWGGLLFAFLYVDGFLARKHTVPLIRSYILMIIVCYFQEKCIRKHFAHRTRLSKNEVSLKQILRQLNEIIIVVNRDLDVKYCNGKIFLGDTLTGSPRGRPPRKNSRFMRQNTFRTAEKTFFEKVVSLELYQSKLMDEICPEISRKFGDFRNLRTLIEELAENGQYFKELCNAKRISCGGSVFEKKDKKTLKEFYEIHISSATIDDQECVVLIMTNIYESIKRLKEINDIQKNILSTLSHELQTPLNTCTNCLEAASKHDSISEEIKDSLIVPSLINCRLLESFVNDVLDFVQIKTGNFAPTVITDKILPYVNECVSLLANSIKTKGISLLTDYQIDQYDQIQTDFRRLKQILINVLGNAVKYTFSGSIKLSIHPTANGVAFSIKDEGIGMCDEEVARLLLNLKEGTIGRKVSDQSTGAGLGLIVANELTRQLNPKSRQELRVFSVHKEGTEVIFEIEDQGYEGVEAIENCPYQSEDYNPTTLPLPFTKFPKTKSFNDFAILTTQPPKHECNDKTRVLVVDDDGFNIHTIETMLASLGVKCDTAFNGKMALERIEKKHEEACCEKSRGYDLIIMDFNMPLMDGLEATRQIRNKISNDKWKDTVIVGCTAYVGEDRKIEGINSGMNDCINKPVTKAKIQHILSNLKTQADE